MLVLCGDYLDHLRKQLDGSIEESGIVPVLKYDTKAGQYTSFEKVNYRGDDVRWSEYVVKPASSTKDL